MHEPGSFLDMRPLASRDHRSTALAERPGTQIGPYKLLQQIGEGGMGVVYMAEQNEPVEPQGGARRSSSRAWTRGR